MVLCYGSSIRHASPCPIEVLVGVSTTGCHWPELLCIVVVCHLLDWTPRGFRLHSLTLYSTCSYFFFLNWIQVKSLKLFRCGANPHKAFRVLHLGENVLSLDRQSGHSETGILSTVVALENRPLMVAVSSPAPGGASLAAQLGSVLSGCEVTQTHAPNFLFYSPHANLPNDFAFGKTHASPSCI